MRVLVVSPHFPPSNTADMQRVRMLLPYLEERGIKATVLAVHPDHVASNRDEWLSEGIPENIPIHRASALSLKYSRIPGLGTLSQRAISSLRAAGDKILSSNSFDLIYFSTTEFPIHTLGPRWKRKFRIPFIMDYQDPWVSDYYRAHPEMIPPGGRVKYAVADWLNRRNEPAVLAECSGITSVSEAYPNQISDRYGKTKRTKEITSIDFRGLEIPSIVLPFPGDDLDISRIKASPVHQSVFDPTDGFTHWLYIGRGGQDMHRALRGLFQAITEKSRIHPGFTESLKIHFVGTSYAASGKGIPTIFPIAQEHGLGDCVCEHTSRIPYSETLQCLQDADALIVPGSDDPAYTASKIYPYLLSKKPTLAIFHEESSVVDLISTVGGASLVSFATGDSIESISAKVGEVFLPASHQIPKIPLDVKSFSPFTAKEQTTILSKFFQHCLEKSFV